jgi:formate/nitrite transporter FocA (FNT family)
LFWSGLAAGLSMGFSLAVEGLLRAQLPDVPWRPLISKCGYCVGFLIVILGRQQLFTENTLTPILPLLKRPSMVLLLRVLRFWIIVLVANLIGAFIFAWTVGHTDIFKPNIRADFRILAMESMDDSWFSIFLRAVFAGWLIALMKWLLPFAKTSRVSVIIIITYIIGIGEFSPIIAGSVKTLYAVSVGAISWADYLLRFMTPTLLGNIAGGVSLVAAINHAQVVSGEDKR